MSGSMEKFNAVMEVSNINIRREKAGDEDGPIAVDVTLKAELGEMAIKGLFHSNAAYEKVLGRFWEKDGELACIDVGAIKLTRELEGKIKIGPDIGFIEFEHGQVNKAEIRPKPARLVDVKIRVQANPSSEQIAKLTEFHGKEVHLVFVQRQGELLDHAA